MTKYIIDFRKINSLDEAHEEIKNALGFPDYYGKNLDALNDCLAEIDRDHLVYILYYKKVFDGFLDILKVFDDNNINYEKIMEIQETNN